MLYAHYDRESGLGQTLDAHLKNVAKAMSKGTEMVSFPEIDGCELNKALDMAGRYHDIGKAMRIFQNYLKTGEGDEEKSHALISAVLFGYACTLTGIENEALKYILFVSIAKHHQDVSTYIADTGRAWSNLGNQFAMCAANIDFVELPYIERNLGKYDAGKVSEILDFKSWLTSKRRISDKNFFMLQYTFSKLVNADKIDSAGLETEILPCLRSTADIDTYIKVKSLGNTTMLNSKRESVRAAVLNTVDSLSDDDIRDKRIFTFTAPTGTGKTLASMNVAINLQGRLRTIYGYIPRIIAALPFINILEQTAADYERIFGDVLVHYSLKDFEEDSDKPLKDRYLLTESWESHVVVTTFVQFFESILTGKNKSLIKLNKMSGSIVILDEIQSIPAKYLPLIGAVIERMSEYYGTRFILMTATQPEIVKCANMLLGRDGHMEAIELLKDNDRYYEDLKRTKIVPVMDKVSSISDLSDFIGEVKGQKQSALIVVNTIPMSIELFDLLKENYRVLYLSTNLTGIDRKKVIEKAKQMLEQKIPFIMVSTQTVEAGVDLDFDIGFRDMGPLESIIQAAGRINRSGKKENYAPLYLFDTGSWKYVYKFFGIDRTKKLLEAKQSEKKEIFETEYKALISEYYEILLGDTSYDKRVYQGIKELDYDAISEFRLIDVKDTARVIIECDDTVTDYLESYCRLAKFREFSFETKAQMKRLLNLIGKYTVEVSSKRLMNNRPCRFSDLYDVDLDMYVVPNNDIDRFYGETGFKFIDADAIFL